MLLRLVYVTLLLAVAPHARQAGPVQVSEWQVHGECYLWTRPPMKHLPMTCTEGYMAADGQYRVHFCVENPQVVAEGGWKRPRIWLRFHPDPTWLPTGYLP